MILLAEYQKSALFDCEADLITYTLVLTKVSQDPAGVGGRVGARDPTLEPAGVSFGVHSAAACTIRVSLTPLDLREEIVTSSPSRSRSDPWQPFVQHSTSHPARVVTTAVYSSSGPSDFRTA